MSMLIGRKEYSKVDLLWVDVLPLVKILIRLCNVIYETYYYYKHQFQSNDEDQFPQQPEHTLPFTPIHVNDIIPHLEYLVSE